MEISQKAAEEEDRYKKEMEKYRTFFIVIRCKFKFVLLQYFTLF